MSSSPDWSDFVSKTSAEPGHKTLFYAFCQDCGCSVKPCWRCEKRKVSEGFSSGLCTICWNSFACPQPNDPTDPSVAPMFLCSRCHDNRISEEMYGRKYQPDLKVEIYNYDYKPVCACCSVSPSNVARIPKLCELPFHSHPNTRSYNMIHAKKAFEKEMEFSGNAAVALTLYTSFFRHRPKDEEPPNSRKILQKILKKTTM